MPDYWALIAAKNASFSGDFRVARYRGKKGSENEASLAAIRGWNVGSLRLVAIPPGSSGNRGPIVGN